MDSFVTSFIIEEAVKHEFQAETRQLLDIVARSLYSEKEVKLKQMFKNCRILLSC